jgi:hypothetical protein
LGATGKNLSMKLRAKNRSGALHLMITSVVLPATKRSFLRQVRQNRLFGRGSDRRTDSAILHRVLTASSFTFSRRVETDRNHGRPCWNEADGQSISDSLDAFGKDGWEQVSVIHRPKSENDDEEMLCFFKKPV